MALHLPVFLWALSFAALAATAWACKAKWYVWPAAALVLVGSYSLQRLYDQKHGFLEMVASVGNVLSIDAEAHVVTWEGQLSYFMPNLLFSRLQQHPKAEWTLVLKNVPGGSIDAGSALLGLANDYGITTARVEGECLSMCANIWIMFPKREIVEGSVLGWHGLYDPDTDELLESSVDEKLIPLLVEQGFPEHLVRQWTHLPSSRFYYMTKADLERFGIDAKSDAASKIRN